VSRSDAGRADDDVEHREELPANSLSIVICTCNRCASLATTLASVNACRLPADRPVELVVIDNNSTDDTATVCADFALVARMRFRRVLETRQGLSFARNRGVAEAAGDVVIFTDDDVLVDDKWIVIYAQEFGENHVDCVFGRVRPDWRGYRPPWFSDQLRPAYALLDYGDARLVVTDALHEFFGANFAIRKDAIVELGGFDVRLGRTMEKLYIGEETRIYHDLLSRGRAIVYNSSIDVKHVIDEGRKEKAYLLKYYSETSHSLVYMSLQGSPKRRVFGIPLVRAKAFAAFYATALPRLVHLALKRDAAGLFALRLTGRRNWRMILLYLRARFAHVD
jgi:glycosyltransferase involved in cell wall biosynthesis